MNTKERFLNPEERKNKMTEERKDLKIQDLLKAFEDAGYPKSRVWIYRQEDKGNLILPRSTTNYKKAQGTRKKGFVREMTQVQIDAIVKAFLPGGKAFYDYRKEV